MQLRFWRKVGRLLTTIKKNARSPNANFQPTPWSTWNSCKYQSYSRTSLILNLFKLKKYILPTFYKEKCISELVGICTSFIWVFMKSQVLHTVWDNISGEAAGEIWNSVVTLGVDNGKDGVRLLVAVGRGCEYSEEKSSIFQSRIGKGLLLAIGGIDLTISLAWRLFPDSAIGQESLEPPRNDNSGFKAATMERGQGICRASVVFELDGGPTVQVILCVLLIPMFLTATAANLLVISSVLRSSRLRRLPSNLLLVGLALSDLSVGVVAQPTFTVFLVSRIRQESVLFCSAAQAAKITGMLLSMVSLLTLAIISLDRYAAIHFHLRYQELVTVQRGYAALIAIWVSGGVASVSFALGNSLFPALLGLLALAVIVLASCSILRVLRRHQRQIAVQMQAQGPSLNLPQFRRSFMNMQILFGCLLLCYLPFIVLIGVTIAAGYNTPAKQSAAEVAVVLAYVNSSLNPLLCCWRYRPIRAAMIQVLRDIFHQPVRWQHHWLMVWFPLYTTLLHGICRIRISPEQLKASGTQAIRI